MPRGKRAEARSRYLVRAIAEKKGWDTRHPQKGGDFLEEQEIEDFFPDCGLQGNKPDFLVCKKSVPILVVEAKKRVETAEQNRLKAKKDAQTKVINAKAEADANKILEKQLTNKILAQQWIKKWNGEVPKVSGDNKSMINIGELMK